MPISPETTSDGCCEVGETEVSPGETTKSHSLPCVEEGEPTPARVPKGPEDRRARRLADGIAHRSRPDWCSFRAWSLIVLLVLLLPAGPAAAQGDTELARRYYKLGEELYNRSAYQEALEQFKKSYKLARKPALLYNMARCHEPLGQHQRAIELYEEYLTHNPPNADKVRARIQNLRKLIERRARPEPATKPASQPAAAPAEPPPSEPEPLAPDETDELAPSGPRLLRIAGWVMVGLGVAGVATGAAMGALAADRASQLEDLNAGGVTEWSSVQSEADQGKAFQTGQIVGLAAGGALLAAGAVLVVLDLVQAGKPEQRQAWLAPAPTPGGVVLGGGISF